jgi:hypothetical protein
MASAAICAGCRCRAAQGFFGAVQALNRDGKMLLAYHDRSDGGLFATVCEMSFAACRRFAEPRRLCYDPLMNDVDGSERFPQIAGRLRDRVWRRCSPRNSARCCRSAATTAPR